MSDSTSPLERYRLAHDLSHAQLAQRIADLTGYSRSPRTWNRVCQGEPMRKTTAAIVDRFLKNASSIAPGETVL